MERVSILIACLLIVTTCSVYNNEDYDLTSEDINEILDFDVAEGRYEMQADGFSTLTLVSIINQSWDDGEKLVVFETTGGELMGGTTVENSTAKQVRAVSDTARITLRASKDPGEYRVRAFIKEQPELIRDLFIRFSDENILTQFAFNSPAFATEVPADGDSLTQIDVLIDEAVPLALRQVSFKSSQGNFSPDGTNPIVVKANQDRIASAFFKSTNQVGVVRISAEVNGFTQTLDLVQVAAGPDLMTIITNRDSLDVPAGDKITFETNLYRNSGTVTPNTLVRFYAKDSTNADIGRFSNSVAIVTNGSQPVSGTSFIADGTSYRGPVQIIATNNVNTISDTLFIRIID